MGKTVPSYRMALEFEIAVWRGFRKTLQSDEEKQAFDELMDMCRTNAMAAGNACNPIIFEPMVMSILVGQQKKLRKRAQPNSLRKTHRASSYVKLIRNLNCK